MTYRGCVPDNEVSPFSDGWQEAVRCTTKDGKKTCTCDDDDMCNGADGIAKVTVLGAVLAAAAVVTMAL